MFLWVSLCSLHTWSSGHLVHFTEFWEEILAIWPARDFEAFSDPHGFTSSGFLLPLVAEFLKLYASGSWNKPGGARQLFCFPKGGATAQVCVLSSSHRFREKALAFPGRSPGIFPSSPHCHLQEGAQVDSHSVGACGWDTGGAGNVSGSGGGSEGGTLPAAHGWWASWLEPPYS